MSQKREAQVSVVELQQEHRHDESNNKYARNTNGKQQQQQDPGLNVDCKQSINPPPPPSPPSPPSPPPHGDDPIITQFKPVKGQWELNDENINRIDPKNSQSLLHNYCQYINTTPLEVYRYLIEVKGCDVNVQDKDKNTPLYYALFYFNPNDGDTKALTYLLSQKDVNRNIQGKDGNTIFHWACIHINKLPIEIFKLLIETQGCDLHAKDKYKDTPLHRALREFKPINRDISVLQYLFNQTNVDVNTKGKYGCTLLHIACQKINYLPFDVFKLLIETRGCDVNAQDDYKNTPLRNALYYFSPNSDINVLIYLFNQTKVHANLKGQSGYTLLHWACIHINKLPIEIFKLLIEKHGGDVTVQDDVKDTPLHRALREFKPINRDISVLQYLFNQTNTKGESGDTILHYACESINKLPLDVFKLLIQTMGCDVNVQNDDKDTPLHNAFRCFDPNDGGDITVLTYLINQTKVHLNIKGKDGNTLLHYACEKIHDLPLEIFKLLIGTHGADVNIQDNKKDSPLHNAFSPFFSNHDDHLVPVLMYLFSQKNVDVNIKGKDCYTTLHLACICEIVYSNYGDDDDDEDDYDDDHDGDEDDHDHDHDDDEGDYSSDDDDDSDEGLEDSVIEDVQNQKADTDLCRIVEAIAERCVEQIVNESSS
jgi:ankyrin repeat protein